MSDKKIRIPKAGEQGKIIDIMAELLEVIEGKNCELAITALVGLSVQQAVFYKVKEVDIHITVDSWFDVINNVVKEIKKEEEKE